MTNSFGSFQLASVGKLPNVTVAYPGEHWSDGKAAAVIIPGQLVIPGASGAAESFHATNSTKVWSVVDADIGGGPAVLDPRACIALRTISVPDINPGSEYNAQLTPNDIMNLPIAAGAYVHVYRSGAFHLTLIAPDDSYAPGDLLGFDPAAAALTGKPAGSGAWVKVTDPTKALLEVEDWRPLTSAATQGVVTAKSLRSQD